MIGFGGEFAVLHWIVSNNMVSSSDWVTLNHYRRFLECYYHHVSLAKPLVFPGSILHQTCFYHSVKYDEYFRHILTQNEYKLLSNTHLFYPYNIFGVPGELLYQWVDFVGERLMKLKDLIHVETFEDACEFVKNDSTFTAPQEGKNTDIVYQARIYGFVTERLSTLFFLQYPGEIYHCEVKLLESHQKI